MYVITVIRVIFIGMNFIFGQFHLFPIVTIHVCMHIKIYVVKYFYLMTFLCSLINSRGVVDELVWEEEIAAREAGYGATSSVPKVRAMSINST